MTKSPEELCNYRYNGESSLILSFEFIGCDMTVTTVERYPNGTRCHCQGPCISISELLQAASPGNNSLIKTCKGSQGTLNKHS